MQFAKPIIISSILLACCSLRWTEIRAQVKDGSAEKSITHQNVASQKIEIKGLVRDAANNKELGGVSVSVEGFSASLTDDHGRFKIDAPNENAVLMVSISGYQTQYLSLRGSRELQISLYEESYTSIYDEAIMPFAKSSKIQLVGAVSSLKTEGAWNRINETVDSYLQGLSAGLSVQRKSGTPTIGGDMLLRGYNSLYAKNEPLIVVDGMIYDNGIYGSSLIAANRDNKLAHIELKDIDNITVIKDGGSTYGSRGANGVILITTSRAQGEATKFDFAAYSGFNSKPQNIPLLDAEQYRLYLSELLTSKPGTSIADIQQMPFMQNALSDTYYTYRQNTNWQDKVLSTGYNQNYYLKVAGGDNIAKYSLSLGYLNADGAIKNTGVNRYHTRFNADLNLSQKLKGRVNLAFTRAEQDLRDQGAAYNTGPLYLALVKAPFLTTHAVSSNNILSPNSAETDIFGISNPYAAVEGISQRSRSYRFAGTAAFDYSFNKHFVLNALMGITYDKARENVFIPELGIAPVMLNTGIGYNSPGASVNRLFSIFTDSWLSYKTDLGRDHHVSANLGFRYNDSKSESDYGLTYNTASDDFVTLGSGMSSLRIVGGNLGRWNWLNSYLNINYNALNKYFLEVNMAADASSRFGKNITGGLNLAGNKYALLPSVGASWLVSSESFMNNMKAFDLLKLRLNYSVNGNDDIGNYTARKYYVSQNFLGRQGLVRGNIGNTSLKWETVKKVNLGLDASFLNERLTFNLDVYDHHTDDKLIYENIYSASGLGFVLNNSGSMRNRGIELNIAGRILNNKDFKWDLGLNVFKNDSKILTLPKNQLITNFGLASILTKVGEKANLFYGYKTAGVFASSADVTQSGLLYRQDDGALVAPSAGDMRFQDLNGDKIIDDNDRTVIGDPNPAFQGAITNTLRYKNWSLGALFTFSQGNDIFNGTRAFIESMSGYANQSPVAMNRWRKEGDITSVPRAVWNDPSGNARFSDRWIENGSYLRLRTLSLTYDWLKPRYVKSLSVFAVANNLFTATKYLGYDPEFSASSSVFTRGIDNGMEPLFRTVELGLRIGL